MNTDKIYKNPDDEKLNFVVMQFANLLNYFEDLSEIKDFLSKAYNVFEQWEKTDSSILYKYIENALEREEVLTSDTNEKYAFLAIVNCMYYLTWRRNIMESDIDPHHAMLPNDMSEAGEINIQECIRFALKIQETN